MGINLLKVTGFRPFIPHLYERAELTANHPSPCRITVEQRFATSNPD